MLVEPYSLMPEDNQTLTTPFQLMGGSEVLVQQLVRIFYAHMAEHEGPLARAHEIDASNQISQRTQDRFAQFLLEWLGGPALYTPENGHPRLRMRHARVAIDTQMRDAWLRCMQVALNECQVTGEVRAFLDARFADVADFLRNRPE